MMQGLQHFRTGCFFGEHLEVISRDIEKKSLCKLFGLSLVEVPTWWDFMENSLAGTLYKVFIMYYDSLLIASWARFVPR
jgi:hypothetical protein